MMERNGKKAIRVLNQFEWLQKQGVEASEDGGWRMEVVKMEDRG